MGSRQKKILNVIITFSFSLRIILLHIVYKEYSNFKGQTGVVAGCGSTYDPGSKDCFVLNGSTWTPMAPMGSDHCPYAPVTQSHLLEGLGWWVGGPRNCSYLRMSSELLTLDNEWLSLPVDSPYGQLFARRPCSVPLNSTHILFTGGFSDTEGLLDETWVLNMESLEWTASTPMLTPR